MQALGTQKKQGSIVEAISQAILSGQIPAGTEMTQKSWQKVSASRGCPCAKL